MAKAKAKGPFHYYAKQAGTLSNPYQRIREGAHVILQEPIECKWLLPANEKGVPIKGDGKKPLLPYMDDAKTKDPRLPNEAMPTVNDPKHEHQMEALKRGTEQEGQGDPGEPSIERVVEEISRINFGDSKEVTKDGKPNATVLGERLGFPVSGEMRDEAFAIFQQGSDSTEDADGENAAEDAGEGGQGSTGDQEVL